MSELKPCPFCGNELPVHYIAMQNRYVQLISCPFCNATVSCNKFLSDKDALATWNTRPIEDELHARIAELEAEKECEMRVFKDGNAWCFVLPDFQDLQVSSSVWMKEGVLDKIYKELRSVRNE